MKNLIIIAAGGMGRTLYDMARESLSYGEDFVIKGFLDDNLSALDSFSGYPPVLAKIDEYMLMFLYALSEVLLAGSVWRLSLRRVQCLSI